MAENEDQNPPQEQPQVNQANVAMRNQRASVIQRINHWINFTGTAEFAEEDIYEIKTRIQRGENSWRQMEEIQLETVGITAPADVLELGNEFMELEDRYYQASTRLTRRLRELQLAIPQVQQDNLDLVGAAGGALPQRLRLELKPQETNISNTWGYFDGNLRRWKEFKERYEAAIHKNDDVSASYKFSYLKNSLRGKAADSIRGYAPNADNYEEAWLKLNHDFDRSYPLAREYLRLFFALKPVSDPATAEELQHISNVTGETLRNLESLKYPVGQWDMIIVHMLHDLLNAKLAYDWNMELLNQHGDQPTTKHMIAFLDKRASAATGTTEHRRLQSVVVQVEQHNQNNDRHRPMSRNNSANSSRNSSRSSSRANTQAHGTANNSETKWTYPCGKCDGNHKIFFCPQWLALTYSQRIEFIKKNGLCILCLKRGHNVNSCHDMSRCKQPQCKAANDTRHNSHTCKYQVDPDTARPAQHFGPAGSANNRARKHGPQQSS